MQQTAWSIRNRAYGFPALAYETVYTGYDPFKFVHFVFVFKLVDLSVVLFFRPI